MKSAVRCAIYTRTSTEEGLDQAFNSLDAQREACAAYIMSQAGEGWVCLSQIYNDGGFSGGNIERPALKALLADIDRGLIDIVVVYKIDRLTRALADFAKLVEQFDKRNVSFVSVTQAFSTTTSMGRLTLNVLLSFAQFERELTAERIRDKFAASRRKGIFMGGNPPLGYDAGDRKLVINDQEAETVRFIFRRYLELKSLAKLRGDLEVRGIRSKAWTSIKGNAKGNGPWFVGSLTHLLRNRVYIGEVVHKGDIHPGEHDAIVARNLFDEVQAQLDTNRTNYKQRTTIDSQSLLTGLIFDEGGHAMSPKTARRPNLKAYVYYVSQAQIQNRQSDKPATRPVAASTIECLTRDRLFQILQALDIDKTLKPEDTEPRKLIRRYITRIEVGADRTTISFDVVALAEDAGMQTDEVREQLSSMTSGNESLNLDQARLNLLIHAPLPRRGGKKSLEGWDSNDWSLPKRRIDPNLVKALTRAHLWRDMIEAGEVTSVEELAAKAKTERKHLRGMLRLAFLAPDIQRAILTGQLPQALTLTSLLDADLPANWVDQRRLLGLA